MNGTPTPSRQDENDPDDCGGPIRPSRGKDVDVAGSAALLGMSLPMDRAGAIAADLVKLAERVLASPVQPGFEDEPADFRKAQR
ncbi:hypothetical protein [Limobrevibacterium gyesilva]|uniref:Uncharacterized protein n=1 Tax=Limobrevibacterium gyesilva TaxID=2991712 RepID=A0AA41YL35_9PROT|nr:hypothetical protein [Limobrevibacterium gyesilva]MCW3475776.1 hypothetical protein [Limobrevibacterium gyesilva]